jgi:GT2 family glycosyltransferase
LPNQYTILVSFDFAAGFAGRRRPAPLNASLAPGDVKPSYGCVIITRGTRPDDLRRAVESVARQRGVDVDMVVVGNGWRPEGLPAPARSLTLTENIGAPAGRNVGVAAVQGDLLLFLDDDASLAQEDLLERIARRLEATPDLGAVQPRIVDPSGRRPPREWVPRLHVGDRARSSDIVVLWEGAVVVRRSVLEQVGGWPARFVYFHSGVDLGWRIWDAGYRMWYAGDLTALHPALPGSRHANYHFMNSRNRVWVARRNLPLVLAGVHIGVWLLRGVAGVRSVRAAREMARGYAAGFSDPPGDRKAIRWRTVWRMTRAGRPPII